MALVIVTKSLLELIAPNPLVQIIALTEENVCLMKKVTNTHANVLKDIQEIVAGNVAEISSAKGEVNVMTPSCWTNLLKFAIATENSLVDIAK
jgi:hypothetical protein